MVELRELIHGIHPQMLTDLGSARRAARTGRPVDDSGDRRTPTCPGDRPSHVEATAYFVVAEALTNVGEAQRCHDGATVTAAGRRDVLTVEVSDDGRGGADPRAAPASPAWPTGWPSSTAGCCCPARSAGRPCYVWSFRASQS